MSRLDEIRQYAHDLNEYGSGTPEYAMDPLIGEAATSLLELVEFAQEIQAANDRYVNGHANGVALSIDIYAALRELESP